MKWSGDSETNDEAAGEALRMAGYVVLGDACSAVAVVDAPVYVRKNGGVYAPYPSICAVGEVSGGVVLRVVGGDAPEDLEVGLDGEVRKRECDAGSEESAGHVAGEIAARVAREGDGAEAGKAVVEAEGSCDGPGFVVDASFFAAASRIECEFGLGVQRDADEQEEKEGEGAEDSSAHA